MICDKDIPDEYKDAPTIVTAREYLAELKEDNGGRMLS
tara:strand:+ start:784 stop:897 length:114 start_codon:yes stop_codon:yes gene_type:complete